MNTQKKYRMSSWYWGNYCVQLENGRWIDNFGSFIGTINQYFNPKDLEEYIEEEHGWHHSEEFRIKGENKFGGVNEN